MGAVAVTPPELQGERAARAEEHGVRPGARLIGLATLASRVLGLRARHGDRPDLSGAGGVPTPPWVALPDSQHACGRLLRRGALSTAIVPVFTDYALQGPREDFARNGARRARRPACSC